MAGAAPLGSIEEFLGSAHIFSLALTEVVEAALLRSVAAGKLTPAQMKVLKLVSQAKGQTVCAIATFLDVSNAAASKAIDRLVRRGFLRRDEGQDRRSSHLALTEEGATALAEFETARNRRLAPVFSRLPDETLRQVSQALEQLAAGIVSTSPHPERVCLQCGVYFEERCLLHGAVRPGCQYRRRTPRPATPPPQGGKFE
jgi:DNA-binding MarR family transcriptional regulator